VFNAHEYIRKLETQINTATEAKRAEYNTSIASATVPEIALTNEVARGIDTRITDTQNSSVNIGAILNNNSTSIEYDRLEKEYEDRSTNSSQQVQELQRLEIQETTKQYFNIISAIIIVVVFVNLIISFFSTPNTINQTGGFKLLKLFTHRRST
jgi:hypothetical protein